MPNSSGVPRAENCEKSPAHQINDFHTGAMMRHGQCKVHKHIQAAPQMGRSFQHYLRKRGMTNMHPETGAARDHAQQTRGCYRRGSGVWALWVSAPAVCRHFQDQGSEGVFITRPAHQCGLPQRQPHLQVLTSMGSSAAVWRGGRPTGRPPLRAPTGPTRCPPPRP